MKQNLKKFKKFIICDADYGIPMSFSGEQLCFCTHEGWDDNDFPVKLYSYRRAKQLIKVSIDFRESNGFSPGNYVLFPVKN
jgi:hypothetical protein